MQAIILAVGMGKRLKSLTEKNTKCMVKVNGVPLIDRMLSQLDKKNLNRIIIIVGYECNKLIEHVNRLEIKTPIMYIENNIYYKTNNIYSLSLAKNYLCEDDTLLFESDLIFEDAVIDLIINDKRETLALVDKYESWMDGTCVKLTDDDVIENFIPGKNFKFSEIKDYYKTVNIYKFSKNFSSTHYVPFLIAYEKALGENEYYEQVLRVITMLDEPGIKAKRLNGELWYEIDDIQDLDIASSMFTEDDDERVDLLNKRYGGYWRYPQLIDFCYLVNPYFPPQRLIEEIKTNFEKLLTQYPSGMRVNSLLASKNFGVKEENIVVGNGAAEIIKSVMKYLKGSVGIIRPTFEEYSNRYENKNLEVYWPNNDNYVYTSNDIMKYFDSKNIENLIIINPDNPSGNYIEKKDLLNVIDWAYGKNIKIVIDESFVDFSDEIDSTLIQQSILDTYNNLYVIKSISKSYGVPGIRLGILASGDIGFIDRIKKDVSIWNINSFAEFYLQISEKYQKDYVEALSKFRKERKRFCNELCKINGIRVIPSQANYIMVEVINGITAKELTRRMIVENNILIKNLVVKISQDGRQYIRIAVKNTEENDRLIEGMRKIFI